MSNEDKTPKKSLINWKSEFSKILTTIVGVIVLGVVSFAGIQLKRTLDKVEENEKEVIILKTDLKNITEKLGDIVDDLDLISQDFQSSVGSIDGRIKSLEIKQMLTDKEIEYLKGEF